MIIHLIPQMRGGALTVSRSGDILTVNGDVVDLSVIPDGSELPAGAIDNEWFTGALRRIDGALYVSLILPHASDAPEARRFPADIIDPPDGPIALPGGSHGDD